jgi:hypothetical protein
MQAKQQVYIAYLLRLWLVESHQIPIWCASLENPHTGERLNFTSLARLFAFLEDQCGHPSPGAKPPTAPEA